MFELMNVIKQQSDELHELLNTPYGTKVLSRLEATETGDNARKFTRRGSNNDSNISVRDAINLCDVNPITID